MPIQARSRDRLARVLEVADRPIAAEGVEALTMIRVAGKARISVGSLYQYLTDREAVIETLAAAYIEQLEAKAALLLEFARQGRCGDPIGALVDAFAQVYREDPGLRALWFGKDFNAAAWAADREHKRRMAVTLRDVILAQGAAADVERLDIACRAAYLMGDAVLQEAFRSDPDGDPKLLRGQDCTAGLYGTMRTGDRGMKQFGCAARSLGARLVLAGHCLMKLEAMRQKVAGCRASRSQSSANAWAVVTIRSISKSCRVAAPVDSTASMTKATAVSREYAELCCPLRVDGVLIVFIPFAGWSTSAASAIPSRPP
ncbi:TetR/AcrR family transcriptional regulator [Nocardia sp. R16R-3T]